MREQAGLISAVAFLVLFVVTGTTAAPLELADSGRTRYAIVIAGSADYGEEKAANELAHFLWRMTGAEFPVRRDSEPVSDSVRSILDGHLVLSRQLAEQAHWPAIDVLASVSRSMKDIVSPAHFMAADRIKQLMSAYQSADELISLGAYQSGSNPEADRAIRMREPILKFVCQSISEQVDSVDSLKQLQQLVQLANGC